MQIEFTRSKKITFKGTDGSSLLANLELPLTKPSAFALFAHCFTCSKDSLAAFRISKALTQFGIAVLRFDFTGLGGSEGDFANTNFSSNISDLLQAANFLRDHYQAPTILIGHSLGGAAVLASSMQIPEAQAIVTIGAPADLEHLKNYFNKQLNEIQTQGQAEVELAGRKFTIKKQFIEDLEQHRLLNLIQNIDKPLLIFHSQKDEIVNIKNGYTIFDTATHSKSFISLDNANHLLTNTEDAMYVANILSVWASRYVKIEVNDVDTENKTTDVIVYETREGRFTQEIIAGRHILAADEPVANGGNDLGPSPYEFLLASLGVCTSMTVRMYADLKKIPLERTIVKLSHDKIYAKDCKNCESDQARIDHIDRIIEFQGNLTEEQRAKLLEISNKCPVHRTLTSKIIIDTKM